MPQRLAWLDTSALSPNEFDAYDELLDRFNKEHANQQSQQSYTPAQLWAWLAPALTTFDQKREEEVSKSSVTAGGARAQDKGLHPRHGGILSFFRTAPLSVGPSPAPTGTLLALLRLVSHAESSKHLTRDHIFLQTTPSLLDLSTLEPIASSSAATASASNPFRRPPIRSAPPSSSVVALPSLSPVATVRVAPPPPPPFKRRPPSPTPSNSTAGASNPFRLRTSSSTNDVNYPASPPASTKSSPTNNIENAIASPPLPPRPKDKPLQPSPTATRKSSSKLTDTPAAYSSSPIVPPLPFRQSSFTSTTSSSTAQPPSAAAPPRMSIISSSTSSHHLSASSNPPIPAPKPRSKFLTSTHIGPSTQLRNSSSSPSPHDTETLGRKSRSNSVASNSTSTPPMTGAGAGVGKSTFIYAEARNSSPAKPRPHDSSSRLNPWPPAGGSSSSGSQSSTDHQDDDTRSVVTAPSSLPTHQRQSFSSTPQPPSLSRSRTLGSKPSLPPPPPKRRPDSILFSPTSAATSNPFNEPSRVPSSSASVPGSTRVHHRAPSLSGASNASSSRAAKDLSAFGQDISRVFEKGGRQSEELWGKAKEQMKGRRRERNEGRERLVEEAVGRGVEGGRKGWRENELEEESPFGDGAEGDGSDEEVVQRRKEYERDRVGAAEGWVRMQDTGTRL
ncbi:hypothetical protein P7C70_g7071, partial [Phenoliferia sp. Uapishka_3]